MIEVDGEKLRTEAEWERRHRHVLKSQLGKGVTRTWRATPGNVTATWYREDQTRPWSQAQIKRARKAARKERERKRREAEAAAREAELRDASFEGWCKARAEFLCACWGIRVNEDDLCDRTSAHTAWQWLSRGLVPLDCAVWREKKYSYGAGVTSWFYCDWYDVRPDEARAAELLKTGPREYDRLPDGRPYDGHPWW